MKYLKDKQYYIDLYDRHTVEVCRRLDTPGDLEKYKDQELSEQQIAFIEKGARELLLHFETGERYLNKSKTIREWMDRDKQRDDLYESAQAPEGIRCLTCRNRLNPTFKEFWSEFDKPDRVLFMYDCPNKCLPRRSFFSDGEEWRTKPNLCPKCDIPVVYTEEAKDKIITIVWSCNKCDYKNIEKIDLTSKVKEDDIDENFTVDRDKYCITDEEGKKFQEEKWRLDSLKKFMDEWKEEEKAREEKLKLNPKGFHLNGTGYTCAICGRGTSEGDNWYDEYGIKCLVCQKSIDEGEIPAIIAKDKDLWYTKYDIEKCFNVKGPRLRSWIKKGIIKPRIVSHYGKGSWYEFFLIEDNKDFLPPKKMVESHSVSEKQEDGTIHHKSHPWHHFGDPVEHLKGYKIMDHLKVVKEEPKSETEKV